MPAWVIWLLVAAAFAAGEVATLGLYLAPISVAAALAAAAAGLGAGAAVQFIVFIVVAIASLVVLRPLARRHMKTPAALRTGAAALVGSRAVVLERVDHSHGTVKIGGEVWTAR